MEDGPPGSRGESHFSANVQRPPGVLNQKMVDRIRTIQQHSGSSCSLSSAKLEGLELLKVVLSRKKHTKARLYFRIKLDIVEELISLHRLRESFTMAGDCVKFGKRKFGSADFDTLNGMEIYARICGDLGRPNDAILSDVQHIKKKILHRDHPKTRQQLTNANMLRRRIIANALDLAMNGYLDQATSYLVDPGLFRGHHQQQLGSSPNKKVIPVAAPPTPPSSSSSCYGLGWWWLLPCCPVDGAGPK